MKASTQRYLPTPRVSRQISGMATIVWTCAWKPLEMATMAGVPNSHVMVLLQIENVIDGLWLE